MSNPKISIIIPVYNTENFIKECLNSIINQTFKDIEIICINDGSTDDSLKILNEYNDIDDRIRVFSQKNLGAGAARNLGIEKSRGDYILFIDGDDWIENNTCKELYAQAIKLDTDMILFNAIEHKPNNEFRERIYFPNDSFKKDYNTFTFDYHFKKNLVMNGMLVIWSKFYKSSFLKEFNFQFKTHKVYNDIQFHISTMMFAKKIGYLPTIFYHYNRLDQPSLQNRNAKTNVSYIILDIFSEIQEFLIKNDKYDEFKINFLKFILVESKNNIEKVANKFKWEFFDKIRQFFLQLDVNDDELKQVPKKHQDFYIHVINSEDYLEYYDLENLESVELNDYENILLNCMNEKNEELYQLKKQIYSLKSENTILNNAYTDYLLGDTINFDSYSEIKEKNLFDEDYYRYHEGYNGNIHPYIHYIYQGFKEGKNPSKLFDSEFYTNHSENIQELNPLVHFINYGLPEGYVQIRPGIQKSRAVNRLEIDKKISKLNESGVTKEKRNPQLIVSITSYPKRIKNVKYSLFSLLTQSLKPDKVVLWLSQSQFPNKENDLPQEVLDLKEYGLEIEWCEDLKSYKKLIPSLKKYPNDLIVTMDDDIFVDHDWLEKLYNYHLKYPHYIICHRARLISFDNEGHLSSYSKWNIIIDENKASFLNFFTGAGGVLYPPNSLDEEIFNEELFMKLTPTGDDIWFWAMAVKKGTKVQVVDDNMYLLTYVLPEEEHNIFGDSEALWVKNSRGLNDIHMKNVMDEFPDVLEKIKKCDRE